MSRHLTNNVILFIIIALTIISLIVSVQTLDTGFSSRIPELAIYALVTAFALILSVPLSRSQLSVAHAIGIMAFLSLPANVIPAMTIAIFFGGILGGFVRSRIERQTRSYTGSGWYAMIIYMSSQVTISFFVASFIYVNLFNAPLPIHAGLNMSPYYIPLAASILSYVILYFLSFIVQVRTYTSVRPVLVENFPSLFIILVLPIPFALLAASVAQIDTSVLFFTITIVGAVLVIFGLFTLNRTQQRLHKQLDEMRSISVATRAMRGNLELEGLLSTAYVQVSQLLDTNNFTVVLLNENDMRMTFPLVIRDGEQITVTDTQWLPADYPLIEHVMETGLALLIDSNVNERVRSLGLQNLSKSITSWLSVPLITGEQTIGAFVVQSYDQRQYDEDDLRMLNIVVASTSIAIENARLYRQKSIRAEQLATLNQVTSLLTGTLAPNEVLDMVVSSASTISEAEAVSVYLFDEDNQDNLTLARSAGLSDDFIHKSPAPLLATRMVKQEMDEYIQPKSLLVQNLDDPQVTQIRQRLLDEDKHAFIEHPLVFGGQNLGVLVVYYNKPQSYYREQIDMIQAFATQAAQAINNARRFESADKALEQRVEQLYVLAAMGRLLNASLETDKIYEVVLTYATDATKAPRGLIAVYRQTGSHLYVPAQRGYPYDMFNDADFLQQGLSGRVLSSGQALRISDSRLETGYLPLMPQTRSILISPIMKGREILGVIMLESDTPGAFSEGDGHFVAQISNQAVVAADNTQLFQRIREARDNMKVILDAMHEGIILIDEQGIVAQTNPHISIIELSPEDIIDQHISVLSGTNSLRFAEHLGFSNPAALQNIIDSLDNDWENIPPHDYEIHDESFGIRYIQRQIIPVRDADGRVSGIMLVFYNKSEEHELAASREALSQMIVHDLRSPLTSVTTSLSLLQRLVPRDAEFGSIVEQTTTMSRRAIRQVLTRVDSLLDISKMQSGEMNLEREQSHIRQIIDNVKIALDPLAEERDVTIKSQVDDSLPLINIDADKIERMILNLVDNAIKYSPSKGEVIIQAHVPEPDFMQIEVVDSGPGIPDDYKTRLFDRYVQIEGRKTVRRGVGLGLTFCKLVTEAHGGDIWVDDNPGGAGSVFKATLPITKMSEAIE